MSAIPAILLVEDNEDDYEATVRSLKKNHFLNPVHWCKNGREALEFLQKAGEKGTLPDLILLDLNMPGLDGRKTLEAIKSNAHWRKIPVVILTTSDDERDIEGCYALGANTYVQKPVDLDGLFAAIQRLKEYWFEIAILPLED